MNTPVERPAESAGELYYPTPVTPEEAFQAIGRLRKDARDEIHRLICFLDDTDNHMEREEAVDDVGCDDVGEAEPSLGWTEQEARWGRYAESAMADIDNELDTVDDEPSLGALPSTDQTTWEKNGGDDREGDGCPDDREGDEEQHGGDEHDGAEPDEADNEPMLGWTERISQAALGPGTDEYEIGPGAVSPQNRTSVEPSVDQMRKLRKGMQGGYLDKAMVSLKENRDDVLLGGELSFPGGQKAFDEMMRRTTR